VGSSLADRVARLEAFSLRVAEIVRVLKGLLSRTDVQENEKERLLHRAQSSVYRASEVLLNGSSSVERPALWLPAPRPGTGVRKDSTRTSPTI